MYASIGGAQNGQSDPQKWKRKSLLRQTTFVLKGPGILDSVHFSVACIGLLASRRLRERACDGGIRNAEQLVEQVNRVTKVTEEIKHPS
jgi:hypothetical protein